MYNSTDLCGGCADKVANQPVRKDIKYLYAVLEVLERRPKRGSRCGGCGSQSKPLTHTFSFLLA
jgi:hypothetical protein